MDLSIVTGINNCFLIEKVFFFPITFLFNKSIKGHIFEHNLSQLNREKAGEVVGFGV